MIRPQKPPFGVSFYGQGSTKARKLDKIKVLNIVESPRQKRGFLLPKFQAPKNTNSIFGGKTTWIHSN